MTTTQYTIKFQGFLSSTDQGEIFSFRDRYNVDVRITSQNVTVKGWFSTKNVVQTSVIFTGDTVKVRVIGPAVLAKLAQDYRPVS